MLKTEYMYLVVLAFVLVVALGFSGCCSKNQVTGNITYVGVPCEGDGDCPDFAVLKVDDYYLLKEPYEGYGSHSTLFEPKYHEKKVVVYGERTTFEVDNTTYKGIILFNGTESIELKD